MPLAADDLRTAKDILEHSGEDSITSASESDALSGLCISYTMKLLSPILACQGRSSVITLFYSGT